MIGCKVNSMTVRNPNTANYTKRKSSTNCQSTQIRLCRSLLSCNCTRSDRNTCINAQEVLCMFAGISGTAALGHRRDVQTLAEVPELCKQINLADLLIILIKADGVSLAAF